MNQEVKKIYCTKENKEKFWQRVNAFFKKHYQTMLIFSAIFLLLFLGGLKFNPFSALVISLIDTIYIALIGTFFNWFLSRKNFSFNPLSTFIIIALLILSVHILFFLENLSWHFIFGERHWGKPFIFNIFKDIFLVFGTFFAILMIYSSKQRTQAEKLNYEKQAMELRFLRSQTNPHFLFNLLNNIYTLVYTKDDKAPDAILKLAELLRYVTDECQADTISIEKEIKYIENYIDLQLLKIGETENLTFEYDIDNYSVKVPPMLLQPVIENCFKYSDIDTNKNGQIFFSLKIRDNFLTFSAFNTKKTIVNTPHYDRKGIGISNIEQRLLLYYGKKAYSLHIEDLDKTYQLTMEIDLSKN